MVAETLSARTCRSVTGALWTAGSCSMCAILRSLPWSPFRARSTSRCRSSAHALGELPRDREILVICRFRPARLLRDAHPAARTGSKPRNISGGMLSRSHLAGRQDSEGRRMPDETTQSQQAQQREPSVRYRRGAGNRVPTAEERRGSIGVGQAARRCSHRLTQHAPKGSTTATVRRYQRARRRRSGRPRPGFFRNYPRPGPRKHRYRGGDWR